MKPKARALSYSSFPPKENSQLARALPLVVEKFPMLVTFFPKLIIFNEGGNGLESRNHGFPIACF